MNFHPMTTCELRKLMSDRKIESPMSVRDMNAESIHISAQSCAELS